MVCVPRISSSLEPSSAGIYTGKPGLRVVSAGREIWQQTGGRVDAFVSGAGTGGTIAGVSQALKSHDPAVHVVLADPQGSSLFNKVGRGGIAPALDGR